MGKALTSERYKNIYSYIVAIEIVTDYLVMQEFYVRNESSE